MTSALDKKLSAFLRPLVDLDAVLRVAQFPNTACIGLHYMLAHETGRRSKRSTPIPAGRIGMVDWNHVEEAVARDAPNMTGIYIFYCTKSQANKLRKRSIQTKFLQSVPISRFRPRYAFLADTPRAAEIVRQYDSKFHRGVCEEIIADEGEICIYTDVTYQAKALMSRLELPAQTIRYAGEHWPLRVSKQTTLLYYGATCTAYMRAHPKQFLALEIEDSIVDRSDEFETHALYVIPNKLVASAGEIRESLSRYHEFLFASAADEVGSAGFSAMQVACNELFARSHPAFGHEILASAASFQQVLRDHHRPPD